VDGLEEAEPPATHPEVLVDLACTETAGSLMPGSPPPREDSLVSLARWRRGKTRRAHRAAAGDRGPYHPAPQRKPPLDRGNAPGTGICRIGTDTEQIALWSAGGVTR
jgi:hypothetical protein